MMTDRAAVSSFSISHSLPACPDGAGAVCLRPAGVGGSRQAVLIDAGLPDRAVLVDGMPAGVGLVEFGGDGDGLTHLARWAALADGYDALHLVCHGAPGRLMLGARTLDRAALAEPGVADALGAIGLSLRAGGAMFVYACELAQGEEGAAFVAALEAALGAPVAASATPVGAAARGGSWTLHAGAPLQAAALSWPAYGHTLTYSIAAPLTDFHQIDTGGSSYTTYKSEPAHYAVPMTLTQQDVAGTGWDFSAVSRNSDTLSFQLRGYNDAAFDPGDGTALRAWSNEIESVTFKATHKGFHFDLTSIAIADGFLTDDKTITFQALDIDGNPIAGAVATRTLTASDGSVPNFTTVSLAGDAHFTQIFGFKIAFPAGNNTPLFDNISVANIVTVGPPATTVDAAALSNDSNVAGDFITNTGDQTVSGTLSAALAAGETVQVSYDNGLNWRDATGFTTSSTAWSDATIMAGSSTLLARVTNTYGSSAPFSHAYTIDADAPTAMALSAVSASAVAAVGHAALATLSSTDATAVTYALAIGDGSNDADNNAFAVSGSALNVGNASLAAGTYHIYLSATDAAGNVSYLAQEFTVVDPPTVTSIVRAGGAAEGVSRSAASVTYTVTFSEDVTGVGAGAFSLAHTGSAGGAIASVAPTASASVYTVTVDTLAGDGALSLDLKSSGAGIQSSAGIAIAGGYNAGAHYVLDHTAPTQPLASSLSVATDTGGSHTDGITSNATPTVTGSAEANAHVTLYDGDGTTVLGTATADGSGAWSIASSALAQGPHDLTVKATDAAGNVSIASTALHVVVDTTGPADLALSTHGAGVAAAASHAAVATLSSTDLTAVTYALPDNGAADDNGKFVIDGNTLKVGGTALAAGVYHLDLQATDAAGNVSHQAQTFTVGDAPTVTSIVRAGAATDGVPAGAASVAYTVTFSDDVTGVAASDFTLTHTGSAGGAIASVAPTASANVYTVTVDTLAGDGELRLDLKSSGTAIQSSVGVAIAGGYNAGAHYLLDHTAPTQPLASSLSIATDTGGSHTDGITSSTTPTVTGSAEAGAHVTLYDGDGTTVLGTATADGAGAWSIASSTLAQGPHDLTVKATDAAGNVSAASAPLHVVVDTAAPADLALSAHGAAAAAAVGHATVATLGSTDLTGVTYSLAGSGAAAADNGKFVVDGSALKVGSDALAAGVYHINLQALDAAGNVSTLAETFTVSDAPLVTSIVRAGSAASTVPVGATSIVYTVTFSDDVTGVDAADFTLAHTGNAGGTIASVVPGAGANVYTVTVDTLSGDGTLRLDLKAAGTGIQSGAGGAIGGGYSAGATYTLDHTAPAAPAAPALNPLSDSGALGDGITNVATPIVSGTAEANAGVTLYDGNGTTVLGTATADATGHWSIASSLLSNGRHSLTVKATDAAGNVSVASGPLNVTIATSAAAPTGLALAVASDSGVAGDGVTRVIAPTLTGHASAGATVKLYDTNGSTVLGTTTADASGNWSLASAILSEGAHTLTAKQIDLAGNVSTASGGLSVKIDTVAPVAPAALSLAPVSDSGVVGDNRTTIASPVIRGTGEANATVTLYDGNGTTVLGTATVDGGGNWSLTSSALSAGMHTLTAKQSDIAGNVSAPSMPLVLGIEVEAPPAPPATTVDGVAVTTQPIVLPGGGGGTQLTVPIVTAGRVETSGNAGVADIPLATSGGATLLMSQLPVGFGLTASGGASQAAVTTGPQLIQAILSVSSGHPSTDQGHLTGNGTSFLSQLTRSTPLLVDTVALTTGAIAPDDTLTLTGTSTATQRTALVIDATHMAAGAKLALNTVDFAAIIGAADVTAGTAGQVLSGDAAAQIFRVAPGAGGAVFAGGGGDTLVFGAATAATNLAGGAPAVAAKADTTTVLHGGLDSDTAVFAGNRADYAVDAHQGYLVVTPTAQPTQHAVLINVETIRFADATVAVSNADALTSIAGLYHDVLGRQADYTGFDFWCSAQKTGITLGQIALEMMRSPEFRSLHGDTFNGNAAHDVEMLYQAIFSRHSDAEGLAFWTDGMAHGVGLDQVAQAFLTSAEGQQHKMGALLWDFMV